MHIGGYEYTIVVEGEMNATGNLDKLLYLNAIVQLVFKVKAYLFHEVFAKL